MRCKSYGILTSGHELGRTINHIKDIGIVNFSHKIFRKITEYRLNSGPDSREKRLNFYYYLNGLIS